MSVTRVPGCSPAHVPSAKSFFVVCSVRVFRSGQFFPAFVSALCGPPVASPHAIDAWFDLILLYSQQVIFRLHLVFHLYFSVSVSAIPFSPSESEKTYIRKASSSIYRWRSILFNSGPFPCSNHPISFARVRIYNRGVNCKSPSFAGP